MHFILHFVEKGQFPFDISANVLLAKRLGQIKCIFRTICSAKRLEPNNSHGPNVLHERSAPMPNGGPGPSCLSHHGLWATRRHPHAKRASLVPGTSCARFLRALGPAGTSHPLCHGSASARMFMSVRRRHLSRRWRNVGPSSSQDESESESSSKLLMAWEDASCQSFCAPNVWSQNVWYECKLQNSPFLGCTSAKRSGAKR